MTAEALSREFNILWDNIESGAAPAVDEYEKSIFLTIAQESLVLKYYSLFDRNEYARRALEQIVKAGSLISTTTPTSVDPLDTNSVFYELPSDLWLMLHEHAIVNTKQVPVIPISLDDFNAQIKNPFRKPYNKFIWRLDVTDNTSPKSRLAELICPSTITKYSFRYLEEPTPVITSTSITEPIRELTAPYANTIDPILGDATFGELLDFAVKLAYDAFMDGKLHSQQ